MLYVCVLTWSLHFRSFSHLSLQTYVCKTVAESFQDGAGFLKSLQPHPIARGLCIGTHFSFVLSQVLNFSLSMLSVTLRSRMHLVNEKTHQLWLIVLPWKLILNYLFVCLFVSKHCSVKPYLVPWLWEYKALCRKCRSSTCSLLEIKRQRGPSSSEGQLGMIWAFWASYFTLRCCACL